jgi:hypothetical protein
LTAEHITNLLEKRAENIGEYQIFVKYLAAAANRIKQKRRQKSARGQNDE